MITVYLLGHRVGDIEEPVLYVKHKSYDYDGVEVTKGIPDPFVESLVHDSIIVQIPLLHGRVNNRLVEVLSVFDQTNKDGHNRQVLRIDDAVYKGDADMEHILHRLLTAASDSKLRQDMNVEDEYFSAIESRDTAIMKRDQRIAEQDAQLEEQSAQLEEQSAQLEEQSAQLEEQSAQLEEQSAQLEEQSARLEEQRASLLASAKAMKSSGMSEEQIAVLTKLDIEEIRRL